MKRKIKCAVCGEKFTPTAAERYTTVRDHRGTGLTGAFGSSTPPEYYDTFDCPACGVQIRVGERLPILGEEVDDPKESTDSEEGE